MPSNFGSRDCPWSCLVVAALRSVANADRGPRLRRRGPGFEASPIRVPVRLEKYIGKIAEPRQVSLWILSNGQWDIVKHRMAVSKLLRPFAMCSMVKSRMAVSKLLGPFDACSMVKDRMAVSKFLRPIAAYSMVNNRAQHS